MNHIPDNEDVRQAQEDRLERILETLPVCVDCAHPIQQDFAVCIDGAWYCDSCLDGLRRLII